MQTKGVTGKTLEVHVVMLLMSFGWCLLILGCPKKAALILGLVLPFKVEGKPKEKKKSTIYFFLVGCGMKDISFAREDFGGGSCNFECYDGAGNIGLKLKKTKTFPFGNTTMKCFVVPEFIYFI